VDTELARAIDRSGDLKGELVEYAYTPRFAGPVREALRNVADSMGGVLDEASAAMVLDDFIFTHRMGAGRTFIDDLWRDDATTHCGTAIFCWAGVRPYWDSSRSCTRTATPCCC